MTLKVNENQSIDVVNDVSYLQVRNGANTFSMTIIVLIVDYLFLFASFLSINYLKNHSIILSLISIKLLILLSASWLIVYFIYQKKKLIQSIDIRGTCITIITSNIVLAYIVSFTVLIEGLYAFSRRQVFGTILVLSCAEIIAFIAFRILHKGKINQVSTVYKYDTLIFRDFSIYLFLNNLLFLILSFYVMTYIKTKSLSLSPEYEIILWVISAVWLLISLFTRKFNKLKNMNFFYIMAPYIKAYILSILTMAVLLFVFRLFYYSRLHFFGTFTILLCLEVVTIYLNFMTWVYEPKAKDIETSDEVNTILKQAYLPVENKIADNLNGRVVVSVKGILHDNLLKRFPEVFNFIDMNLNLSEIDEAETTVFDTNTLYNIETLKQHSLQVFINLHKVNDFKRINRYFLETHNKLKTNGFFISSAETNEAIKRRLFAASSEFLAQMIYLLHFVFHRIIPKLPGLNKLYFAVTRGRNRAISKAEILGRLYFCGFKIVAEKEIGGKYYFIAQCVKYPSVIKNPSYGLTIKLPRIGLNGELKYIYKLRTMHPYSEFIQEYMYEKNRLEKGGKLAEDFRLTEWGKLFRKLWIDELPQIINYLQGDLKLVGVRALSEHYFSLYPKDLQDLRIKFKPGLIPPFYADLPKSFDEIIRSERAYLEKKMKAPIRTDMSYFIKALYNIIIKGARSG